MKLSKSRKKLERAFGKNEFGEIEVPKRFSNVQAARILYGEQRGCSRCFPHGWETDNSTINNRQRNWKRFRKYQCKSRL